MSKVFVTRQISGKALDELKQEHEVEVYGGEGKISREELLEKVKGVGVILSTVTEQIDAQVLDAAGPGLRLVANYAVGYDNIDVAEATRRGKNLRIYLFRYRRQNHPYSFHLFQ